MRAKAITFGNDIDTDQIIGAHHLPLPTIEEMAVYTFEHHPAFTRHFVKGDILVGLDNFGCGSSREQAPAVLQCRGVRAIIARSFARIFYRNAINLGIPLIECEKAGKIELMDELEITDDFIINHTQNEQYPIQPYPPFIQEIFNSGGIVDFLLK